MGVHFTSCLSKASLRAVNPTSAVNEMALSGIVLRFLVLFMKLPESLIYYQPFCIIGFKRWSRNSEHFSVGLPQLELTGLSGKL